MSKEPNNEASRKLASLSKHWFICIESTIETSPNDIHDFCDLMETVCKKYNMRWCQAVWKSDLMERLK